MVDFGETLLSVNANQGSEGSGVRKVFFVLPVSRDISYYKIILLINK